MELYFIKDQIVRLVGAENKGDYVVRTSDQFPVTLEPFVPECEDSKEYCKIVKQTTPGLSDQCNYELSSKLRAKLTIPNSTSDYGKLLLLQPLIPTNMTSYFKVLRSLFGKENLSYKLVIMDLELQYSCGCTSLIGLECRRDYFLRFKNLKFPKHELHPEATMKGRLITEYRMSLIVKLNYAALVKIPLERVSQQNPAGKCKRLLDEALGSDLVIVAANGAEVKCHKNILMVSSDAFRAMFENNMKEGTTNRLEMPDMSEAGVRAFLKFIYTLDLEAACEYCDIALELFRAGDKYGMAVLKKRMKMVICSKPAEWFSVDMAVRLSLLVQDMEEKEEIFKKTAEVLKWYSTNKSEELLASEEYEELFQTHPRVAMKLFSLFLKFA